MNGDDTDYRYENLEIINKYIGVELLENTIPKKYRSYIHVKGTAVNRIPADLELELTPIDIYGNDIPKEELEVQLIHYTVKGTRQDAVESPVEARLIDPKGTGIRKLDGIRLKLKARSNEELRGVTLNKTSQALKLKDLSVELVGKIVYDAN